MPAGPTPPRAPGYTSCFVGSGAHSSLAAAIRWAVATAVPDGASIFASWCISMISAVSKYGAASSAKRIISTALMAKLLAIRQLLPLNAVRTLARSSSVKPVVPTTAWMPCIASHGNVIRAADATVKSTTTCAWASARARNSPATATPPSCWPTARGSIAATSSRASSAATASHTVAPMRPPAPTTPTRIPLMETNVARLHLHLPPPTA